MTNVELSRDLFGKVLNERLKRVEIIYVGAVTKSNLFFLILAFIKIQ